MDVTTLLKTAALAGIPLAAAGCQFLLGSPPPPPEGLPQEVYQMITEDIANRRERLGDVRIDAVARATWPDGCLGLADPGEMCTQVMVPGFRVTVTLRTTRYEYRSDAPPEWLAGRQVRRKPL